MTNLLIKGIALLASVYIADWLLNGISFTTTQDMLLVSLILVGVNLFVKPVLKILTFPITLLTMGLFPLILNTLIILVIAQYVPGFKIIAESFVFTFIWAAAFGLLLSIFYVVIEKVVDIFV